MNRRIRSQKGSSLIEYGVVVAMIAVVCIGSVTSIGHGTAKTMCEAIGGLTDYPNAQYVIDIHTGKGSCVKDPYAFSLNNYFF